MMLLAAVEGLAVMGENDEAAALYPSVLDAMADGTVIWILDVRLLETVAAIAAACGRRWETAVGHFESAPGLADTMPNRVEQAATT